MRITKKEVEQAFKDWLAAHKGGDSYKLFHYPKGYVIKQGRKYLTEYMTGREMYLALTFVRPTPEVVKTRTMDEIKPGDKVRCVDRGTNSGIRNDEIYVYVGIKEENKSCPDETLIYLAETGNKGYYRHRFTPV